jgi:hypothetical protein
MKLSRSLTLSVVCNVAWIVSAAVAQDANPESLYRVRGALETFNRTIKLSSQTEEVWNEYLGLEELNEFLTDDDFEISAGDVDDDVAKLARVERPIDPVRLSDAIRELSGWKQAISQGDASTESDAAIEALQELDSWFSANRMRTWQKLLDLRSVVAEIKDFDTESKDDDRFEQTDRSLSLLSAEEQEELAAARVELRRALSELSDEIEFDVTDDLSKAARRLKLQYRDIPDYQVRELRQRAQNAVRELGNFLQTGPSDRRYGWETYLKLPQLINELSRPDRPAQRTLVASYQQFDSGHPGLEKRKFEAARLALQDYLQVLGLSRSQETLESKRQSLQNAINALDTALVAAGETKEEDWKDYLDWKRLTETAQDSSPNIRDLGRLIGLFEADEKGLELSFFTRVRRELVTYAEMLQQDRGPQFIDRYRSQWELLARSLESHSDAPSATTAAELTDRLEWLRTTGYGDGLADRVKSAFRRPNLRVAMNGEFFIQQISDTQNEAIPVNRCFEGAHVTGCARTNANFKGQLVPQQDGIAIDILVNGTTIANTVARQRKVSVFAEGVTSSFGTKRIYFTLNGLSSSAATANACTNQQICGAQVDRRIGRRLIGRFAQRKARKTVPKAQNLANTEAVDTVSSRLDKEVGEMLAKANSQFNEQMAKLRSSGFYPDDIRVNSTSSDILLTALFAGGSYLAAPTDPPKIETTGVVKAQIHESVATNMLAKVFGGRQIDNVWLADMMRENGLEVPDDLLPPSQRRTKPKKKRSDIQSAAEKADEAASDDEPEAESDEDKPESWSMTFDRRFPIIVRFTDEGLNIAIRGREFSNDDQEISDLIEMSANYRVKTTDDGKFEAKRIGDVDVIFVNSPGRLDGRQLTYKTFLLRKMDPLFREKFSTDDLPQVGQMSELIQGVKLESLETGRGWMTANVDIDASVLSQLMPMK